MRGEGGEGGGGMGGRIVHDLGGGFACLDIFFLKDQHDTSSSKVVSPPKPMDAPKLTTYDRRT